MARSLEFHSLVQEVQKTGNEIGSRGMIDVGRMLYSNSVVENSINNSFLEDFLKESNDGVCKFFESK